MRWNCTYWDESNICGQPISGTCEVVIEYHPKGHEVGLEVRWRFGRFKGLISSSPFLPCIIPQVLGFRSNTLWVQRQSSILKAIPRAGENFLPENRLRSPGTIQLIRRCITSPSFVGAMTSDTWHLLVLSYFPFLAAYTCHIRTSLLGPRRR